MMQLPPDAAARISRIEALLDEAERALGAGGALDEAAYSLRETRARYLPDTLRAYLDVPPSLRGERDAGGRTPDELLVAQLDHLERATAQRLRELAARRTESIAANGAFLTERFGPAAELPEAAPAEVTNSAPLALVRTFLDGIARDAGPQPAALVAVAAERFGALVPQLLTTQRGRLGFGAVEALQLTIPVRDGALRYNLAATRSGIEASATKVVRGIALRTESVDLDAWLRGLYEDLGAFVERDRRTRETLTRFLEH
ncbi:MAG: hypothetical protein ABSH03_20145 [Candidatus Lustribacter sp.]|jgi:hypothetical protein